MSLQCDCEPTVYYDGSIGHQHECAIYPWCPHEIGCYVCTLPCGCRCDNCTALTEAHRAFGESA